MDRESRRRRVRASGGGGRGEQAAAWESKRRRRRLKLDAIVSCYGKEKGRGGSWFDDAPSFLASVFVNDVSLFATSSVQKFVRILAEL